MENPIEGQDGLVVFESTHFQKKRSNEIMRKGMAVCGGEYVLGTCSMWPSLHPTEVEC